MQRGTIRTRTMWALFATGGLTALLVGAVMTATLIREVYNQVGYANARVAALLLAHVKEEIDDGRQLIERVAQKMKVPYFDVVNLDPLLGDALAFQPIFDSIYAYGPDENIVIRRYVDGIASNEGRSKNLVEKNDPNFLKSGRLTLRDGKTRTLPVRLSSRGNSYVPVITGVLGEKGEVKGLLSGAISAAGEGFREMIQEMAPGRRGYVVLLDFENRVLARTFAAPGKVGSPFPGRFRERWGAYQVVRPGGIDFAAEASHEEIGIKVLVAIPRDEALAALPGVMARIGVTALVALVIAGFLGIWLAERLTGPIRELLEGIRRVGDGVLTHRLPVEGDDELAEVSRAFNRLAETMARNRMIEEYWVDPELAAEADEEAEVEVGVGDEASRPVGRDEDAS